MRQIDLARQGCSVAGPWPERLYGLCRWLALIVLALCPLQTQARLSAGAFDAANRLYEQGKFTAAAAAYQKLLKSGQASAAIYFNLGNAFFKAGQIGRALVAYRQAEQITPRDPDVRANLQFARNQVQGPTLSPSRWQLWLGRLSVNEWTWLAAGSVWLWFMLLILRQWRPKLKPALRSYAVALGIAAVLLCALAAAAVEGARAGQTVIVIAPEAVVRQAPIEESPSVFTVHDGAELSVLDRKDDWLQVSPDPKRSGWVRRDQVVMPGR